MHSTGTIPPARRSRRAGGASGRRCRHGLLAGLLAALLAVLLPAIPAAAQETITIAPGPEGEDVSYYSFLPLLQRGDYTTMYAHTSFDEQQQSHSMETFVRFPLPQDLLGPGETVLDAFLIMVFAFTFDHDGSPPPPGGELSIHEVLEDWQEATLHYANHPASGPSFETLTGIDDYGPLVFDVSESVRDWAHGFTPNYGFKLSNPFEHPIGFHSFEADVDPALKAQLVVTVPEPAAGPGLALGVAGLSALHRRRARRGGGGGGRVKRA